MKHRLRVLHRLAVAAFLCTIGLLPAAAEENASFRTALASIRSDQLQNTVQSLTDPRLEGREAGTQGGRATAEYLRDQLAALKLPGAGPDKSYFQRFGADYANVLAMLAGRDQEHQGEVLLIGAHYDHIGFGHQGSRLGEAGVLHPGADDNASGTAGVLQLARAFRLLSPPPRRSILFVFFDAEEKGMLGSKHFAANPSLGPARVVLAVNLDMIGRLHENRVTVPGTRTSYGLRRLLSRHNEQARLTLEFPWAMEANADHYPFFAEGVPVLMLHTDMHDDYHRPTDVAGAVDASGMQRIVRMLFSAVVELADRPEVPAFREASRTETDEIRLALERQTVTLPPRLGVSWESRSTPGWGVVVSEVVAGSAAAKAGLRPGDRILRFNGREVRLDADLQAAVMIAPPRVTVLIEHPGEPKPVEVTIELKGVPFRVGITWRVDDGEPGSVIITHVVDGSPAAKAGVKRGDRIYQVNGRDFSGELELFERLRTFPGPLRFQVERAGQLRSIDVSVEPAPLRKAA
jgi:hypothetical protein